MAFAAVPHAGAAANFEIYVVNSHGTGEQRLTEHPALDSRPAWSPDDTRIAFTSERSGVTDIYVMRRNWPVLVLSLAGVAVTAYGTDHFE